MDAALVGIVLVVLGLGVAVLAIYLFYRLIRMAVRDGILDADAVRADQSRAASEQPVEPWA